MGLIGYLISNDLLNTAKSGWWEQVGGVGGMWWTIETNTAFCECVGITKQQYEEYEESWCLRVSKATHKKLLVLASEKAPHYHTLFKIIDARHS